MQSVLRTIQRKVTSALMVMGLSLLLVTQASAGFEHGIMAGEVRSDSVLIWSRTGSTQPVVVRYGLLSTSLTETSATINPQAARDYTFQVELNSLTPATVYYYQVIINPGGTEEASPTGHFKTAPNDSVYSPMRIGFSGDIAADVNNGFDNMTAQNFDLYLAIGDWPYADAATDLTTYWGQHKAMRDSLQIRNFTRSTSFSAIYDDHEFYNDVSGVTSTPNARVQAAIQAEHDYFPFRYTGVDDIYRNFKYGAGVEVFILDTRRYRDANNAANNASKTMLGAIQRQWLFDALSASTADFKLIVSSVPFDHGTTGNDHWRGFTSERQAVRDHIITNQISGAVILTTDQHWLSVNQYPDGIREYETGPLTAGIRNPPAVPAYVRSQQAVRNYGILEYTPAAGATPATLVFEARHFDNDSLLYTETTTAGRGEVQINIDSASFVSWVITGDYYIEGDGTTHLPYLAPGNYTINFTNGSFPDPIDPIQFTVVDEQVTTIEP